jgi:hypothetical protein
MGEKIEFYASLPPIQSAIQLDGRGDGGRIKLDVPASDAGALLLLQHYGADRPLKVTIEVVKERPRAPLHGVAADDLVVVMEDMVGIE